LPLLRLVSVDGQREIEIHDRGVVGRQPGVEGLVEDSSVSRQHATLEFGPRGWVVTDHNSANGTWIDGQRVASAELHTGSELRLGLVAFQVEIGAAETPTTVMPAVSEPPPPPPRVAMGPTQPARPSPFRRSAPDPNGALDFNRLSPASRKRLVDCVAGRAEPRPLAAHTEPGAAGPILAVPLFGAFLLGMLAIGFGEPGSAWEGWGGLLALLPVVFVVVRSLLAAAYRLVRARALPFPVGRFLFPLDVVETGAAVVRHRISSAEKIDATHHLSQGRYSHTVLSLQFRDHPELRFELRPRARADEVLQALQSARDAALHAVEAGDAATLQRLTPLGES